MMAVTYLPRVLPVWSLSSRSLPPFLSSWLRYIPVSVMAAMVFPSLFIQDQQINVGLDNVFLLAAFPTFLVAWRTKSLFGSVFSGMLVVAIARFLGFD